MSTAAARPTPVAASGGAGRASRALAARLGTVVLTLAIVLALWHLLTAVTGIISPARFATPAEVGLALQQIAIEGYSNGRLHEHVLRSVLLVTMGFTVAASVGVALGLAMGASRTVEAFVNPIFLVLRPIPPLAWIPLAIVWLGLGDAAKMMVIFVSAFVPSVINSYTGVRQIDKPIFEAAAMLDITGCPLLARGADPRRAAVDLHRPAPVAAGFVDHAGGGRTRRRRDRPGPDPQPGRAGHLPRDDPGRHDQRGAVRLADDDGSRLDREAGHALEGDDVKPPRSLRSLPPEGAVSSFGTAGRC